MKVIVLFIFILPFSYSWSDNNSMVTRDNLPWTEGGCINKGGKWIFYPIGNFYFCSIKTKDSGKSCSDNNQCQGDCVPINSDYKEGHEASGQCSPLVSYPGGCPVYLVQGKVVTEVCI